MKKVSIIIPTYNRKKLIKTAVKSALIQTYPKKEIIIVDGSTDYETSEILKDFKDDIIIIKDKYVAGVHEAENQKDAEKLARILINHLNNKL